MADQITINSQPKEDQKHIEQMVAVAEGQQPAGTPSSEPQSDRPSWLPEKFKSVEEMAKAYSELESKLGQQPQPQQTPQQTQQNPTEDQAKAQLKSVGVDYDALSQEFNQNGSLTDESYKKLEEAGVPRAVVDQYIQGQQALQNVFTSEIKSAIGGDENFESMVNWAKANVPEADLKAYNDAVSSGNKEQAALAVQGMYARYQAANPAEPNLVQGQTNGNSGDVFENWFQVQEAMRNPLYAKDPAYRAKVEQKLGRSNF